MKKISILIPAYNEQESLEALFDRLDNLINNNKSYSFELLFVDDGSRDNTINIIKSRARSDSHVKYISLSRNFGKETAMIAGLDNVTGDATVIIDADLQHPPELIPDMIKFWEEGYDDVYAKRNDRTDESWLKKTSSKWFYSILQKSTNFPIQMDIGDFRLLDRRCVEALKQIRESQRYTKGMFSWIGFKKKEILYSPDRRVAGQSKWSYKQLFNFAIDGITSFTTAPLRISSVMGFVISFIAFIYIIVVIVKTMIFGDPVAGYPSMMAVILFLGGIQLLSLGIIGEYIGRIFTEVKHRPLYLIQESNVTKTNKKS